MKRSFLGSVQQMSIYTCPEGKKRLRVGESAGERQVGQEKNSFSAEWWKAFGLLGQAEAEGRWFHSSG